MFYENMMLFLLLPSMLVHASFNFFYKKYSRNLIIQLSNFPTEHAFHTFSVLPHQT
uniref:Uncharacterized protein n=1 Tax=Setaria viridis TaxID=4556 RepID=A0A4U6VXU2_SETVI|nr:hypothetical protein SEVIR_2G269575v2 [Setaria viridis]